MCAARGRRSFAGGTVTLLHWLIAASIVAFGTALAPGFEIDGYTSLVMTALLVGAANVAVRPAIAALPFPFPVIALGVLYLLLDGLLLWLAAGLMPGLALSGPGGLVIAGSVAAVGGLILHVSWGLWH